MLISAISILLFGVVLFIGLRLRGPQGTALITCYRIVLGLLFLYMLFPALLLVVLNGGRYVWLPALGGGDNIAITSAACVVATLTFVFGYLIRVSRNHTISRGYAEHPNQYRCSKNSKTLAWGLITVGVILKLYVGMASGGVEMNIARFSGGVREDLGLDAISSTMVALRYISGVADAGAAWLLLDRMRSGKRIIAAAVIFVLVVGLTFIGAGKRLFLLWPILAAVLGIHYYVKPIRLSSLPTFGLLVLGLGFLSLMFRIYIPASIAEISIDLNDVSWAHGSLLKFYFFSLEFASFEVFTFALKESSRVVALFGSTFDAFYNTNIVPLEYFVPRAIWPTKPTHFLDLSHGYRVFVTGGDLNDGGGVASTLLGTSWTLGGPVGFLLSMFSLGRLSRWLDGSPKLCGLPRVSSLCWYALGLVTVFHLFRQGTIAWTAIIVVIQQSGLIIGFLALTFMDSSVTRRKQYHV